MLYRVGHVGERQEDIAEEDGRQIDDLVEDVRRLAAPVMRHRVLTNFHAEADKISTDQLIKQLVEAVPAPKSDL